MKIKALSVVALIVSLLVVVVAEPAAAVDVTVRVTIERIRALDNFGSDVFPEDADFYAVVNVDGFEFDNKNSPEQDANEDDDDISPNWEFSRAIDADMNLVGQVCKHRAHFLRRTGGQKTPSANE